MLPHSRNNQCLKNKITYWCLFFNSILAMPTLTYLFCCSLCIINENKESPFINVKQKQQKRKYYFPRPIILKIYKIWSSTDSSLFYSLQKHNILTMVHALTNLVTTTTTTNQTTKADQIYNRKICYTVVPLSGPK